MGPGSNRFDDNAGPAAGGLALGSGISYLGFEEIEPVAPRLDANAEPAADGLGLGIGIANAGVGRASLAEAVPCWIGVSSARICQHFF
jgi:hypothetical protein